MTTTLDPEKDVLFCGLGATAVLWYRCALPALFMGADWVGTMGDPPDLQWVTGMVGRDTKPPNYYDYKIVVLQQPHGSRWLALIRKLQERGIKVIYEVDDYLHGIRKKADHDFAKHFDKNHLTQVEMCMKNCDAMICSTEWLAKRYRSFNRNIFVCENGLDTSRYNLTAPPRPMVNIGWAGATGHRDSIIPWLQSTARVMESHDDTCFVSIGQAYAAAFAEKFGPERGIVIPWTLIEQYPSAMTMFDIALAPAGRGSWYRGKSDLRFLEAGALGIPIIASPEVYPHIEDRVTGFHATTPEEVQELLVELVEKPDLRRQVGEEAKVYVHSQRDMRQAVNQWIGVFAEVLS